MAVNNVGSFLSQPVKKAEEVSRRAGSEDKSVSGAGAAASPDRVDLSTSYHRVSQVQKAALDSMKDEEGVRMDRVEQLRAMIQNKTYQVKPEEIAEKMMQEVIY